jgi:hypothetical protein
MPEVSSSAKVLNLDKNKKAFMLKERDREKSQAARKIIQGAFGVGGTRHLFNILLL